MIKTASARNLFSRAARQRVHVPDDLADQVEGLLARRCLDYVGLAWRRNGVAIGSETAREILGTTKPALLLVATGSSRDEIARFVDGDPKAIGLPVCDVFRSAELSAALGRNVVNCALVYGKWSERIAGDVQRLRAMRIET